MRERAAGVGEIAAREREQTGRGVVRGRMSSLRDPAPDPGIDGGRRITLRPYWPNSGSKGR
jgi:hypothetical protein